MQKSHYKNILEEWTNLNGIPRKVSVKDRREKLAKLEAKKRKKQAVRKRNKDVVSERFKKSKPNTIQRKAAERSPMEQKIELFLMQNQVRFIAEYYTAYCYNWKTQHLLYFDFYLPDYNAAIEFDGMHHFKPIYGDDQLKAQRYKDYRKDKYCKERGIKLLRIPYWHSKDFEDIITRWFDANF